MTRFIPLVVALSLVLPLTVNAKESAKPMTAPAVTQDSPIDFVVKEVKTQAKIIEIDKAARTVVLRAASGKLVLTRVPDEFPHFDKLKLGKELVVRYQVATALQIQPAAKDAILERVESFDVDSTKRHHLPGAATDRKVDVLAIIQRINRKANTMTLRGATRTVTVAIPDNVDATQLKAGDLVHAVIVDAVMLETEDLPA